MKNNNDRFVQIGLNIAFYRKLKGMTQLELSERAGISRTHMSYIEAPNIDTSISLRTLFDIAAVLDIEPAKLLEFRKST